jgi:hypothetical protein
MEGDIIETLIDYLLHEQKRGIDVIILAVVGTFIGFFIQWVFNKVKSYLLKYVKKIIFRIKEYNRKVIKGKLKINEYIEIERKLKSGEEVKPYEKKAYDKAKLKLVADMKEIAEKHDLPKIVAPTIPKDVIEKLNNNNKYNL